MLRSSVKYVHSITVASLRSLQTNIESSIPLDLLKRRRELVDIAPKVTTVPYFGSFIEMLGLEKKYQKFVDSHTNLFNGVAKFAPSIVNGKVVVSDEVPTDGRRPNYVAAAGPVNTQQEKRLVNCFKELLLAMNDITMNLDGCKGHYKYIDCQTTALAKSDHKPDLAFVHREEFSRDIGAVHMILEAKTGHYPDLLKWQDYGQILDYSLAMWQTQVTRKFVPILFLHGASLSLFIFFRDMHLRTELGEVFHNDCSEFDTGFEMMNKALTSLHFLLALSSSEFGHVCDFTAMPPFLCFAPCIATADTDIGMLNRHGKQAKTEVASGPEESVLATISARVPLTGRVAYIVKGKFNGKDAVLKLSWTATTRLPENAIYEILERNGIKGIPKLFKNGLLVEDFYGYRLEFIIMEDCGPTFSNALKQLNTGSKHLVPKVVGSVIRQVTSCLVNAFAAGIAHRDVSDGNAAVMINFRTGAVNARVIDWGYAKDMNCDSDESKETGRRWRYDSEKVGAAEKPHDPFTGTQKFMSASTLFGSNYRFAITDIESMFYVVLNALRSVYKHPDRGDDPEAFRFHNRYETTGHIRVSCMAREKLWLRDFGINRERVPPGLLNTLLTMRQMFFFDNGRYIGYEVSEEPEYKCTIDEKLASVFMDPEIVKLLVEDNPVASLAQPTPMRTSSHVKKHVKPLHAKRCKRTASAGASGRDTSKGLRSARKKTRGAASSQHKSGPA
ncbi:hypothetical protein H4R99_004959 [Coemansia sp. RSA 1722]|nr:hypothetical protein H4R99_004959 [Coemansia sp. RSA 1722]